MFLNWKREGRLDQIQRLGSCSALQIFSGLVSLQAFRPSLNIEGTRKYFDKSTSILTLEEFVECLVCPTSKVRREFYGVCVESKYCWLTVCGMAGDVFSASKNNSNLCGQWVASGAGDKVIITYHIICSFVYLALFTPSHLSSIRTVIIITPIAVCARWSESLASGCPLGRQDQINLLQVDSNYTRGADSNYMWEEIRKDSQTYN